MEKATLNLKNDYGFVVKMDITDPDNPDVKVYDFEGNEVAGSGGGGSSTCALTISNETANLKQTYISTEDTSMMFYTQGNATATYHLVYNTDNEIGLSIQNTYTGYVIDAAHENCTITKGTSNPAVITIKLTEPGDSSLTLRYI